MATVEMEKGTERNRVGNADYTAHIREVLRTGGNLQDLQKLVGNDLKVVGGRVPKVVQKAGLRGIFTAKAKVNPKFNILIERLDALLEEAKVAAKSSGKFDVDDAAAMFADDLEIE
jgi:hypothetical protein